MKKTRAIQVREESQPTKRGKHPLAAVVLKKNKLTPLQDLFCQLYAGTKEYYGNGTRAYMAACNTQTEEMKESPRMPDSTMGEEAMDEWRETTEVVDAENKEIKKRNDAKANVAGVMALRLLRNDKIMTRIEQVRQKYITDAQNDFELGKVILQDFDLTSKMRGIEQHNKLRGRIIDRSEKKIEFAGIIGLIYGEADK